MPPRLVTPTLHQLPFLPVSQSLPPRRRNLIPQRPNSFNNLPKRLACPIRKQLLANRPTIGIPLIRPRVRGRNETPRIPPGLEIALLRAPQRHETLQQRRARARDTGKEIRVGAGDWCRPRARRRGHLEPKPVPRRHGLRSEEHTSELQ